MLIFFGALLQQSAFALCVFAVTLLAPAGWIMHHIPEYRQRSPPQPWPLKTAPPASSALTLDYFCFTWKTMSRINKPVLLYKNLYKTTTTTTLFPWWESLKHSKALQKNLSKAKVLYLFIIIIIFNRSSCRIKAFLSFFSLAGQR